MLKLLRENEQLRNELKQAHITIYQLRAELSEAKNRLAQVESRHLHSPSTPHMQQEETFEHSSSDEENSEHFLTHSSQVSPTIHLTTPPRGQKSMTRVKVNQRNPLSTPKKVVFSTY